MCTITDQGLHRDSWTLQTYLWSYEELVNSLSSVVDSNPGATADVVGRKELTKYQQRYPNIFFNKFAVMQTAATRISNSTGSSSRQIILNLVEPAITWFQYYVQTHTNFG